MSNALFRDAGAYGYGWTSYADSYTSSTIAMASHFAFEESGIRTGYKNNRWLSFPLRCLAD